jgi:hypothetical protein
LPLAGKAVILIIGNAARPRSHFSNNSSTKRYTVAKKHHNPVLH